jgi:MoaA/NifB/PqqE/SkfB family radical SAM enzyme
METEPELKLSLAKIYKERQEHDLAIKELKRVISLKPRDAEAHLLLGLIYQEKRQYDSALREFDLALRLEPSNYSLHTLRGNVYNLTEDPVSAEKEYKRAIELRAKNSSQAHFELGRLYENQNRYGDAIKEYEKTLELEFTKDALLRLVQLSRLIGREDLVESKIAGAMKLIPEDDLYLRNVLLNELEMAQRKTVLSSKIRSFTLTLTNRCNLNCLACEAKRYTWEMPRRTVKEIIEFLPYLEYIMWQGGEVFLVDYFEDILVQVRRYPNLKNLIVTNGTLLSEDLAARLISLPWIVLAISVDGVTRESYENIRRGAKFDTLIKNLRLINSMRKQYSSNMQLHLNVTVMRSNYFQLLDFVEFAKEHGFSSILFRPVQGNFTSPENIFVNRDEDALAFIAEIMSRVYDRAGRYGIALDNRLPLTGTAGPAKESKEVVLGDACHRKGLLCYAPWQRLYISWDGNVYPDCMCIWPPEAGIANVKRNSIEEIWNNEGMQLYRRKLANNDYMDICSHDCICGAIPQRYLKFNR